MKYNYKLHPKEEKFIEDIVKKFLRNNKFANNLSKKMNKLTYTIFFDWIDHIVIPEIKLSNKFIRSKGESPLGHTAYYLKGSILPPILLSKEDKTEIVLKPENLSDFIKANKVKTKIHGKKFSPFTFAKINEQGKYHLCAVERRGSSHFIIEELKDEKKYQKALYEFIKRKRKFKTDEKGIYYTQKLVKKHLKGLQKSNGLNLRHLCSTRF